jgi:hypothetical protein
MPTPATREKIGRWTKTPDRNTRPGGPNNVLETEADHKTARGEIRRKIDRQGSLQRP